jgi:hypothetical protein
MSAQEGVRASYQYEITVDHSQFFLEACEREWGVEDLDLLYDAGAIARHLGVAPGVLSIFTARSYGTVRLEIVLRSAPPGNDFMGWDHIAEASLDLPSGCLIASGPESDPPTTLRVTVPAETYRVRVYWGGIETVNEYMDEGQDHYRVVLWAAPYGAPTLLYAGVARPW